MGLRMRAGTAPRAWHQGLESHQGWLEASWDTQGMLTSRSFSSEQQQPSLGEEREPGTSAKIHAFVSASPQNPCLGAAGRAGGPCSAPPG